MPGHGEVLLTDLPAGLAPASGPPVLRRRLSGGPVAPLKIASGCDRRCSFCAIPSFRGSYVSRLPEEILAEAEMLAADGVRELVLVSENSTSYGKDLGDLRALEKLLPQLAAIDGIVRIRPVYLQPAEVRPSLLEALLTTPGVAPYLDLSFQHASATAAAADAPVRRRAALPRAARGGPGAAPELGARSNVIVGFPGETRAELRGPRALPRVRRGSTSSACSATATRTAPRRPGCPARSSRAGSPAASPAISDLVEQLTAARAEERIGTEVEVLVESVARRRRPGRGPSGAWRRGDGPLHQAPEVDGSCTVACPPATGRAVGDLVRARVVGAAGVDLETEFVAVVDRRSPHPDGGGGRARDRPGGDARTARAASGPADRQAAPRCRTRRRSRRPRSASSTSRTRSPGSASCWSRSSRVLLFADGGHAGRLADRGLGRPSPSPRSPTGSTARSPGPGAR